MIWAIQNNQKVMATPNQKATCPICNAEVISKCGSIKVWHWSNISIEDCDFWSEGETKWHLSWKNEFPKEQQEVVITKYIPSASGDSSGEETHRADVKLPSGTIIELQNSPISSEEIKERENFYENMIWVINYSNLWQGLTLKYHEGKDYLTFRWKHPAKSWWEAKKPIFLDIGNYYNTLMWTTKDESLKSLASYYHDKIFLVKKIYRDIPCGGYGIILSKEEFLEKWK